MVQQQQQQHSLKKTNMNKYLSTAVAAGALAFGVSQASATAINGTINFGAFGSIALVGGTTFPSATGISFSPGAPLVNAIVTPGSTGDFVAVSVLTPASFRDITFGGSSTPEWTLGTGQFSFDLMTSVNSSVNDTFLNVSGTGTIHSTIAGLDDTQGFFSLTASRSAANQVTFSFQSTTSTTPPPGLPDGGATAMLLGVGVLGLGAMKRKS